MKLRLVSDGPWKVVALLDDRGKCDVLDSLNKLAVDPQTKATAAGFRAWWTHIPTDGPRMLPDAVYHMVDKSNKIYEFIKGNYRVLCFEAEDRLVVCSHLMKKASRKTPKSEVAHAIALKAAYLEAKKAGHIEIVTETKQEGE